MFLSGLIFKGGGQEFMEVRNVEEQVGFSVPSKFGRRKKR